MFESPSAVALAFDEMNVRCIFTSCCVGWIEFLSFVSVHRIGRTGRCGKTGIATTFINKTCGIFVCYFQNFGRSADSDVFSNNVFRGLVHIDGKELDECDSFSIYVAFVAAALCSIRIYCSYGLFTRASESDMMNSSAITWVPQVLQRYFCIMCPCCWFDHSLSQYV